MLSHLIAPGSSCLFFCNSKNHFLVLLSPFGNMRARVVFVSSIRFSGRKGLYIHQFYNLRMLEVPKSGMKDLPLKRTKAV